MHECGCSVSVGGLKSNGLAVPVCVSVTEWVCVKAGVIQRGVLTFLLTSVGNYRRHQSSENWDRKGCLSV